MYDLALQWPLLILVLLSAVSNVLIQDDAAWHGCKTIDWDVMCKTKQIISELLKQHIRTVLVLQTW